MRISGVGYFAKPHYQGDFALAEDSATPPEVLVALAEQGIDLIDELLVANWMCPADALRRILTRHPEWTDEIANHYNAPRELRIQLKLSMLNVSHVEKFLDEERANNRERLFLHGEHRTLLHGQGPTLGQAWQAIRPIKIPTQ